MWLLVVIDVDEHRGVVLFGPGPTSSTAASPPGGWSSLYKLAVCCPGLHQAGVLFENSDFALERELGPDENYQNRVFPESETIHSQPVPCGDVADCGWSLFDDLLFDTIYDASESSLNQPEVVWIWERIVPLQILSLPPNEKKSKVPTVYARKRSQGRTYQNEAHSVLVIIRDVLDNLTEKQVTIYVRSYLIAQSFVSDNNLSEEVRQIIPQFASISLESMTAASPKTRLTFDPKYTPMNEYEQPPPIQVCQRPAAPRERARRGGERGGQQRNKIYVEHNSVDEENSGDHGVQYDGDINLSLAITNVGPYYPTFDYARAATSGINYSHEQSSDFVTPPIGVSGFR
ncbi:Phytochrome A-associated F-box protein [Capsicum chinense]|nr:Phytochrome A-associated F-box protein [Capsicum chinense]